MEIGVLQNFNHHNIVRYIGAISTQRHIHIILEYTFIFKTNKSGSFLKLWYNQ